MARARASSRPSVAAAAGSRPARTPLNLRWSDVRGAHRLVADATLGVVGVVEAMHHAILRVSLPLGAPPSPGGTRGVTGIVYRTVRGVTRLVGDGIDAVLARLAATLDHERTSPAREAALAALNGVLGDRLAATGNPLAVPMQVLYAGAPLPPERPALAATLPAATPHVVVMLHGLCMGPTQWERNGHDHGAALACELGALPLYLGYNTGRHISENGRDLAALLDRLLRAWPHPIARLTFVCHSMGGLVARSACHYAAASGHRWLRSLDCIVFLGTPHLGAPLERIGRMTDRLLALSPYAAPLGRLGEVRSAGVRDLGHAALRDEDWQSAHRPGSRAGGVPLPPHVRTYAIAACVSNDSSRVARLWGDGLVPVASALGRSTKPGHALGLPAARQRVLHGVGHFDLLAHPAAWHALRAFVADTAPR